MDLLYWIKYIICGVIAFLLGMWLWHNPGKMKSACKKVYKTVKNPYVYISALIFLFLFLIYILWIQSILFPPKRVIVALTNFRLVSGAEEPDNNALISHLQDSLNVYRNDIELSDSVYPEVRDSIQAREVGEGAGAHIVIWGSIEKTSAEAEIIPRITIVQSLGKLKLVEKQPQPYTDISITELSEIQFKKRMAREITDVVLFILGLAKYNVKEFQKSIEILESIQHKNAEILFYIGNDYLFLPEPNYFRADTAYRTAIQERSNFSLAYNNWGVTLEELGRHKEAINKYREAIRINPTVAGFYHNFGIVLGNLGENERAIEKFKNAVRINPAYAEAYCNWGVALEKLGRYQEAIGKFTLAVSLNPKYARAYYGWGLCLGKLERYEEAVVKFAKAVRINPDYVEAYNNWGVALMKQGHNKEAIKKYQKALSVNPNHANAYFNWGLALSNQGKYEEATEKFERFIKIDPNDAEAHKRLGVTFLLFGRKTEAIKQFKIALMLFEKQEKYEDVKKLEKLIKELEE